MATFGNITGRIDSSEETWRQTWNAMTREYPDTRIARAYPESTQVFFPLMWHQVPNGWKRVIRGRGRKDAYLRRAFWNWLGKKGFGVPERYFILSLTGKVQQTGWSVGNKVVQRQYHFQHSSVDPYVQ